MAVVVLATGVASAAPPAPAAPALGRYDTPYYVVYTDLGPPVAAEAVVRLKVLADFYRSRTRGLGLAGPIRQRLPVYLFKNRDDYLATGAPAESAGAFLGDRLVAAATDRAGGPAWNVIQHEAFHQFAAAAQGPELPGWLSEGLAEYFGEALFTGDGFVDGVVPSWRLARVKKALRGDGVVPLPTLLAMSQDQWNQKIVVAQYDQAWSLVHFILHGHRDGLRAIAAFVKALADGTPAERAWQSSFGAVAEFEPRWRGYWLALPDAGSADRYAEAAVAAATSVLARAAAAGQSIASFQALNDAARTGALKMRPDDWLPPSLLARAIQWAPRDAAWSLANNDEGSPTVRLTLAGGTRLVGTCLSREGRPRDVSVRREPSRAQ